MAALTIRGLPSIIWPGFCANAKKAQRHGASSRATKSPAAHWSIEAMRHQNEIVIADKNANCTPIPIATEIIK